MIIMYGSGGWGRYTRRLGRMGARRLGGPVDWKTLPPGRKGVQGSIRAGANVDTGSLEL